MDFAEAFALAQEAEVDLLMINDQGKHQHKALQGGF